MDYGQIKNIIEAAVKNGIYNNWWLPILILIAAGVGAFLGSYLKKKGENLATKEDIGRITKKIEAIRSEYRAQLESHKASLELSNQLKLAALDKRLQKHQEAYTLWRKLLFNLRNDDKIGGIIGECQKWWDENCLYLGKEARSALNTAISLAVDFRNLPRDDPKEIRAWFEQIGEAGKKIVEGVNLPSLGKDEIKLMVIDKMLAPVKSAPPGTGIGYPF